MEIIKKFSFALLSLFLLSLPVGAQEKVDKKQACKQAKGEIKDLQKQLDELKKEDDWLEGERQKWEQKFQDYQNQLAEKRSCSKGNPNNSPDCNRILEGLADTGDQITKTQRARDPLGPKKLEIENKMFKPKGIIEGYNCQ